MWFPERIVALIVVVQREVRVVVNLGKDEAEKLGVKVRILSEVL